MNKLISNNPIYRSKLGKKIIKAQFGYLLREDGVVTNRFGTPIGSVNGGYNPNTFLYNTYDNAIYSYGKEPLIKNGTWYETTDASGKVIDKGRYFGNKKHSLPINNLNNTVLALNKVENSLNKENLPRKKPIVKKSKFLSIYRNRANEISNIKETQQMLKDMKYNIGNYGVDGIWGKDTENAYKQYLQDKLNLLNDAKVQNIIPSETKFVISTIPQKGISNFTPLSTAKTYNKADIRNYIRSKGKGAYDFTGSQRKALRMVMNGQGTDEDKVIVKAMGLFKKGGLISTQNPIQKFKNRNFN